MTTNAMDIKWAMVVDIDKCTGCQACVIACMAENNVPINLEDRYNTNRAIAWIRIERYWEGEYPNVKARFLPMLCQHCGNAPCEPVCPVYATFHNNQGLNVQVYNRCVGTRYCANNCPYHARFFNYFRPVWPDTFQNYLNPDVTVRDRGIMEKCTFCIQRINRAVRQVRRTGDNTAIDTLQPACAQACPTDALVFGNLNNANSRVTALFNDERAYAVQEAVGTAPNIRYLKRIDAGAAEAHA
jgi:molybdopterin-containing oxidoreductase family iron-sulfur binding subunit